VLQSYPEYLEAVVAAVPMLEADMHIHVVINTADKADKNNLSFLGVSDPWIMHS